MTDTQSTGFFQALFDLSFREFITIRIIKFLYIVGIVCCGLAAVGLLAAGLMQGGVGILSIVIAPIAFILWVISLRVWLELVIVVFRIADNSEIIAKK